MGVLVTTPIPPPKCVDAPGSGSRRSEVEKQEAVQHCELPLIQDGPEIPGRVGLEISYSHLSCQHEGHGPGEEADEKQQSSERLQKAGQPSKGNQGYHRLWLTDRPGKELLGAMSDEEESGHDAKDTSEASGPRFHGGKPPNDAHRGLRPTRKLSGQETHRASRVSPQRGTSSFASSCTGSSRLVARKRS